jgi:hypothetical protein
VSRSDIAQVLSARSSGIERVGVRLSDLEPRFVCQPCGHRGVDVRPLFEGRQFSPREKQERLNRVAQTA